LKYYFILEKNRIEVGDKARLAATYTAIDNIYNNKGLSDKALEYFFKSEKISIEVGGKAGLAKTYNNVGAIYNYKGERD
jgi:hypothetical protein